MALTKAQVREILSEAGIDAEHMRDAVEKIIDGHLVSVNALREEADTYRADAGKLAAVQKELDDLKAKTEAEAKERSGEDYGKLKASYDKLKTEYDTYKADQEKKATEAAARAAFTDLLKDTGVSEAGIAKILKWQGVSGVEMGEDGKITNAKDLRKSIREDWPEYITTETVTGAQTPTPPANSGSTTKSRADILSIKDDAEMIKAIEANPAVFGLA